MKYRKFASILLDGTFHFALGGVIVYAMMSVCRAQTLESRIRDAYTAGQYQQVTAMAQRAIASGEDLKPAAKEVLWAYISLGKQLEAGELALTDKCPGDADTFNRIAMHLQTGNARMLEVGVQCMERAVTLEPDNLTYMYDMGLLYWNNGQVDEAKKQCEKVVQKDPGNVGAMQILERIAKGKHSGNLDRQKFARRQVRFRLTLPEGKTPYLAGSWNEKGDYDLLADWKRTPMTKGESKDGKVLWTAERDLATDSGHWFAAVASETPEPYAAAQYLCRFPVYPINDRALDIDLGQNPVHPPRDLLVPREATKKTGTGKPKVYLLCIDSATWSIFMPLAQAGILPHLANLVKRGASRVLHSDPPVSTVAFDILNFGTVRGFSLTDVILGGVGVLKERGINLLNYGDIKGSEHTWRYLATKGIPSLYASWQEQFLSEPPGKDKQLHLDLTPNDVEVAGKKPHDDLQKVKLFLSPEDAAATKAISPSDELLASLYDQGVKKFYQGLRLMTQTQAQVSLVHVGFVDVSYHQFWDSMDSELTYLEPDRKLDRRYRYAIEGIHRLMDQMIGDLLSELDLDRDTLILFSDHGATGGFAKTYYGHDTDAMLVVAGPGIRKNVILRDKAEIVDIVPTVCQRLGVEPPRGYPGHPLTDLFEATPEKKP